MSDQKLLEFEHLIQINDPQRPDIAFISRAQLWGGLVFRARYPDRFNPSLECHIEAEHTSGFTRVIRVGDTVMHDEVNLIGLSTINTRLSAGTDNLQAESITRIEEPEPGALFVRFVYRRDSLARTDEANYDDMLKSAYLQMDRDAIRLLREWFANGWDPGQPWQ
ncbi:MAG: AtaL-like protein [Pseudomonadales bacterium]|nr:AtaL-like protein [Pseudomonadales bacterium]